MTGLTTDFETWRVACDGGELTRPQPPCCFSGLSETAPLPDSSHFLPLRGIQAGVRRYISSPEEQHVTCSELNLFLRRNCDDVLDSNGVRGEVVGFDPMTACIRRVVDKYAPADEVAFRPGLEVVC